MNDIRRSPFSPKNPLFPPSTPASDLVNGTFTINFTRAIDDPAYHAEFADRLTVWYRIHKRTTFAEVTFCPPPCTIDPIYRLHLRLRVEYLTDVWLRHDEMLQYDKTLWPEHARDMSNGDFEQYYLRQNGYLMRFEDGKVLPVMDSEQRLRMAEATLVLIFKYMVNIFAQHKNGIALKYVAAHVSSPLHACEYRIWGYLGFVHQLACKYMLDMNWSGPDGVERGYWIVHPQIAFESADRAPGYIVYDHGELVVRTQEDADSSTCSEIGDRSDNGSKVSLALC
ncbi:hypothetical protein GGF31_008531 [Allomyces arbusculus]|nr:hypothetical protein GGF31_008531 [Allomyces arbusculus]